MGKVINFGFNADDTPSGHLNYKDKDPSQNFHLISEEILTFTQTAVNRVEFTGTGRIGSEIVMFRVVVEDNGEPGSNDKFQIEIIGRSYTRSGNLTQGNIQFHR